MMIQECTNKSKEGFFLLFVRIPRLLGLGAVIVFLAWGLMVDIGSGLTPFENAFLIFGINYRSSQIGAYLLALLFAACGLISYSSLGSRIMLLTGLWHYVQYKYFCSDDID